MECIEAFEKDNEITGKISWHICSDGYAQSDIEKLAEKYTNVEYYGKVSSFKLQELYKTADILFMPSRFLETFWLTALESLSLGTPVCAPQKGGLRSFIPDTLALDESNPIDSFGRIIHRFLLGEQLPLIDIRTFSKELWNKKLDEILWKNHSILMLHDYKEKIWGAEYYLEYLTESINKTEKSCEFYWYIWNTTPWKRRLMFIFSICAFWRGISLYRKICEYKPDIIWMHSILRYIWPWWLLAIKAWKSASTRVYISHHDVGLFAAFPQDITSESEIPLTTALRDFIPNNTSVTKKLSSIGKWLYIQLIKNILPKGTIHIIFAEFMRKPIQAQFWKETEILLFPHTSIYETSSSEGG